MYFFTVFTALSVPLVWASPEIRNPRVGFKVGQTVVTSSGAVSGHAAARYAEVSEYLGIPYAKAPVGDLRFAAPVKYTGSSSLNGSVFGFACPQLPSAGGAGPTPEIITAANVTAVGFRLFGLVSSPPGVIYGEDCLSVNVWSKPQCGEHKKAVMIYIHGGGFTGGSSAIPIFNGASLVDREDVIIVSLNYRTSILGFPGNPASQNNLALLDQRLAIEWVRDNIAKFGGNPAKITIFGESAGGISTDYLSYAFASDPIATGIIAQSGNAFNYGFPVSQATSAANWYSVTSAVGCGNASTPSTTLLACMRHKSLNSILAAIPTSGINSILSPFAPTVDNVLIFSNYSQQIPAKIPVLIGNNDYEAGLFRTQLALGGLTLPDAVWEEFSLGSFVCPTGQRANASFAAKTPIWRYRYHGVFPNTDISSEGGAYHGAELQLLFGTTYLTGENTDEESKVEAYIQGAWAAFAKDPFNGLKTYKGGWPLYNPAKKSLVRLAYNNRAGANLSFPSEYDARCAKTDLAAIFCQFLGVC